MPPLVVVKEGESASFERNWLTLTTPEVADAVERRRATAAGGRLEEFTRGAYSHPSQGHSWSGRCCSSADCPRRSRAMAQHSSSCDRSRWRAPCTRDFSPDVDMSSSRDARLPTLRAPPDQARGPFLTWAEAQHSSFSNATRPRRALAQHASQPMADAITHSIESS